jgi:outer membrane immunogenic protein
MLFTVPKIIGVDLMGIIRNFGIGIVAIATLMSAPALAAQKKKPESEKKDNASVQMLSPTPVASWNGAYAGLNGGGVCDRATATRGAFGTTGFDPIAAPDGFIDFPDRIFKLGQYPNFFGDTKCGAIGGAQVGYNLISGNIVWGAETDLQATSIRRTDMRFFPPANLPAPGGGTAFFAQNTEQASQKMELFGTLRARAGFLATPTLLVYGTGGLAYAVLENTFATTGIPSTFGIPTTVPPQTASVTNGGFTLGLTGGGGFEWMLGGLWRAKLEYLYYRFKDNVQLNYGVFPGGSGTNVFYSFTNDGHIVRVGLNYQFGAK